MVLLTIEGLAQEQVPGLTATSLPADLLAADPASSEPFYTLCPILRPAVTSLMTGLSPTEHGVLDNFGRKVASDVPLLAQDFAASGWTTAAFVASPLVSWLGGLDRGFEVFDGAGGIAFGAFQHYPELRAAPEVVENVLRWLETVPQDRRAFVWVHLSEPGAAPDVKEGGLDAERQLARVAAMDQAVTRLRAALREAHNGPALLVVTSDRVQFRGSMGDLGQGFFVDPAWIRVPLVTERFGLADAWRPPRRPVDLSGLGAYLEEAAALAQRRLATPSAPRSGVRTVSSSAVPWFWCRWSPAVALAQGNDLWIFDGSFRHAGPGGEVRDVKEPDVPQEVRSQAAAEVTKLSVIPPRGPKVQEAIAVARSYGIEFGDDDLVATTPSLAERREIVETLQRARAAFAGHRPAIANRAYKKVTDDRAPVLGGLVDLVLVQGLPRDPTVAVETAKRVLAAAGAHPVAMHWLAHASIALTEAKLAESLLNAYLEREPGEPDALYDLACVKSLEGDMEGAASNLRKAIENGFRYWDLAERDPDLRTLRTDHRFAEIMKSHGR